LLHGTALETVTILCECWNEFRIGTQQVAAELKAEECSSSRFN